MGHWVWSHGKSLPTVCIVENEKSSSSSQSISLHHHKLYAIWIESWDSDYHHHSSAIMLELGRFGNHSTRQGYFIFQSVYFLSLHPTAKLYRMLQSSEARDASICPLIGWVRRVKQSRETRCETSLLQPMKPPINRGILQFSSITIPHDQGIFDVEPPIIRSMILSPLTRTRELLRK